MRGFLVMSEAYDIPQRQLEVTRIDSRSFQEVSPEYAKGIAKMLFTLDLNDGWRSQAACDGGEVDPDLFFPERGDSRYKVEEAVEICSDCPVRQECLDYAIENNETSGVWGGKTRNEIKWIRRVRKLSDQES